MASKKKKQKPEPSYGPKVSDLVTLKLGNPIFDGNSAVRGLLRIHADGSVIEAENAEPFGYQIPKGKTLVVTDLSYYSAFTLAEPPGNLTRVFLGRVTVSEDLIQNQILFVATPTFSNNSSVGGNVSLRSGFALSSGGYLSASFSNFDLVASELFVYGYLSAEP